MIQSNSKLLNYIHVLMTDDDALNKFLIDPITDAEGQYGITKAERAVLRRTVAHLSNKSKNGYTVSRHLGSYRRSLRLLQNVLHHVGSKMVQDLTEASDSSEGTYTFSMIFNLPNTNGPVNFTCETNAAVEKYGGPYAWATPSYVVTLNNPNPTVKEVYDAVNANYFSSPVMPYKTVTIGGEEYVSEIIPLSTYPITADLSNSCYDLSKNPNADFVFWFYSINGKANPSTSGAIGKSFATKTLQPNDTVYWQLIAPDATYGFQPCAGTEGTEYNM
ncbi:hypothetical protein C8N46_112100 [Kordia periserrulae]|uniref:Uncharacterized protein n=1 Tax=Kordia periserrulae TaxID=701523 RepID=A0A2T6BRV1_9FLAO|nr:hypothetical protein [Kordia periserrulae]PTX58792.1 hypothetical protein C8N46_112100 [Kordia periserrulae]